MNLLGIGDRRLDLATAAFIAVAVAHEQDDLRTGVSRHFGDAKDIPSLSARVIASPVLTDLLPRHAIDNLHRGADLDREPLEQAGLGRCGTTHARWAAVGGLVGPRAELGWPLTGEKDAGAQGTSSDSLLPSAYDSQSSPRA